MINFKARGQEFEVDESIFEKNKLTIIYSKNGTGKSVFTKVLRKINGEDVHIGDVLDEKETNITKIRESLSKFNISVFNSKLFNENTVITNESIIISRNAVEISDIEKEIAEFKNNIWTSKSVLKKKIVSDIPKKNQNNIIASFKQLGIKKNSIDFDYFDLTNFPSAINSTELSILETFGNQNDLAEFNDIMAKIIDLKKKIEINTKAIQYKYKIEAKNTEFYAYLSNHIEQAINTRVIKMDSCPICLSKFDIKIFLNNIKEDLLNFDKSIEKDIKELHVKFQDNGGAELFKWDWDFSESFINTLTDHLNIFKEINFEEILRKFASITINDFKINKWDKLKDLKKDKPFIDRDFLKTFKEKMESTIVGKEAEISISISKDKKSIEVKSKGHAQLKEILSSATIKILSFNYFVCSLVGGENNLVVFDDPSDSNDYLNLWYISNEIIELNLLGNTILVLTHDIQFIETIKTINRKGEND